MSRETWARRTREPRGFTLPGLLVLLAAVALIAIVFSVTARQAGRTSHWFQQSQMAFDLADFALKHVCHALQTVPHPQLAQQHPFRGVVEKVHNLLTQGQPGRQATVLLSTDRPGELPPVLKTELSALDRMSPILEVSAVVTEAQPLWAASTRPPLSCLPADPREWRGTLMLSAVASVTNQAGLRVSRAITLERRYKLVSILAPLLGRFSLFLQEPPAQPDEANFVKVRYDRQTGDGATADGPPPLVVISGAKGRLIDPAEPTKVDRQAMASRFGQVENLLDRQGWVFLGGRGQTVWKLKLAHGYSGAGESHLLPGYYTPAPFATPGDEAAFATRFGTVFTAFCGGTAGFGEKGDGLYSFHHGFATSPETIGLSRVGLNTFAGTSRAATRAELGDGDTCGLRLFGTAQEVSPTVVFGPVQRLTIRKTLVQCTFGTPTARQVPPGTYRFFLFALADHSVAIRPLLSDAFGSAAQYEEARTRVHEDSHCQSLNVLLSASGNGFFGPSGVITRMPQPAQTGPSFRSTLLPWLGTLPAAGGLPDDARTKLWNGELESPSLYTGKLEHGLGAFAEALRLKAVVTVESTAFDRRIVVPETTGARRKNHLRVPGIAFIKGGARALDAIDEVESGGILMAESWVLNGNVLRGPRNEPLTLVATAGDITIASGVELVEARLVALKGKVAFPAGKVTVLGGIAARSLDLAQMKSVPGERTVRFAQDMDPLGPSSATAYRMYFGGQDRVVVTGGDR